MNKKRTNGSSGTVQGEFPPKDLQQRMECEESAPEANGPPDEATPNACFLQFRDDSDDLIMQLTTEGTLVYVNPSSRRYWGFSPADCIGRKISDFIHPDDVEETIAQLHEWLAHPDHSFRYENRQVNRDGHVSFMEWSVTRISCTRGGPPSFVTIGRDVTEQRIIDQVLTFIAEKGWLDEGGKFLDVLCAFLGRTLQVPYVFIDALTQDKRHAWTTAIWADGKSRDPFEYPLADTPCDNVMGKELCVYSEGVQAQFPDDKLLVEMDVESYMGIPLWDASGEPIGLMALMDRKPLEEISLKKSVFRLVASRAAAELDRLRTEEVLTEANLLKDNVIDLAPIVLFTLDTDGIVQYLGGAGLKVINFGPGGGVGQSYRETFTGLSEANENVSRALAGETVEFTIATSDIIFNTRYAPLRDSNGTIKGMIGVAVDVSEYRRLEEQLRQSEKMRAIGQLAGGIAHDYNNQLSGIMLYAEMLSAALEDQPSVQENADKILAACERSADLTQKLLDFSHQGKFREMEIDLHECMLEVVDILKHTVDKRIRIETRLTAPIPRITGEPSQIQNAILNLSLNARDAMTDGGTITFATRQKEVPETGSSEPGMENLPPGSYVEIEVSDNGCGMDEEVCRQAFEPFFTTKSRENGTGMGLASVYGTVLSHSGGILLDSKPGAGTRVHIMLPIRERQSDQKQRSNHPLSPDATTTILVIDDESLVVDALNAALKSQGHRIRYFQSGPEAVQWYYSHWKEVKCIILDMVMPDMGGSEIHSALRAVNPNVPILVASGYAAGEEVQELLEKGNTRFIQKPFFLATLLDALGRMLQPEE